MPQPPIPNKQALANLDKIEAKTGIKLLQITINDITMNWNSPRGYSIDDAGNVTGLNLDKCEIADISL